MIVFISGVIFFVITVSGLRAKILEEIPRSMKYAISAGIGFFIALLGLFNSGIIVHGSGSALSLGPIADPGVLLSLFCLFSTLVLFFKRKWYAVIAGLLLTWVIGSVMGALNVTSSLVADNIFLIPNWSIDNIMNVPDFGLFAAVFTNFDLIGNTLVSSFIAAVVSLVVIDIFDTAGTLIGVGSQSGLLDSEGHLQDGDKALVSDAVASIVGAVVGTSTTTSFIESTTGIEAGARTGLMTVVVGILFIAAMLFIGFFGTFTSACTVGALVLVGIFMIRGVRDIEWNDPVTCAMAFMTIFMMGLSGSITDGIAFGVFSWVIGMVSTGKAREITLMMWVLALVFVGYFFINYAAIPLGWLY